MLNLGINIQLTFFFLKEYLKTPYSGHLEYKTLNLDLILHMDKRNSLYCNISKIRNSHDELAN